MPESFTYFLILWAEQIREHPEYRLGQALFNTLYATRPDLSERIRATKLDPFHQDKLISDCLDWIGANW